MMMRDDGGSGVRGDMRNESRIWSRLIVLSAQRAEVTRGKDCSFIIIPCV